jgi:hypothetical protein
MAGAGRRRQVGGGNVISGGLTSIIVWFRGERGRSDFPMLPVEAYCGNSTNA